MGDPGHPHQTPMVELCISEIPTQIIVCSHVLYVAANGDSGARGALSVGTEIIELSVDNLLNSGDSPVPA